MMRAASASITEGPTSMAAAIPPRRPRRDQLHGGDLTSVAVLQQGSRLIGRGGRQSVVAIAWLRMPGWLMAAVGLGAAWPAALVVLSHLGSGVSPIGAALFVAGGAVYTVGAVAYALRCPNLHPAFGYHEVFHALALPVPRATT
jgi:hypothetical protein